MRPLTEHIVMALGEAGAHILQLNIHGNKRNLCAEDGCGGVIDMAAGRFRSVISAGGVVNIDCVVICSPNQPAAPGNIGSEFAAAATGIPGFHVVCIETERLAEDEGARNFLLAFYQSMMKVLHCCCSLTCALLMLLLALLLLLHCDVCMHCYCCCTVMCAYIAAEIHCDLV